VKTAITAFVFVIWSSGCGGSTVKEQSNGGSAGGGAGGSAGGAGGSAGGAGTTGAGATAGSGASAGSVGAAGNGGASGTSGTSGANGSAGTGATGGAAGASGSGGASGTGGSPGAQCRDGGQCRLFSDCCYCVALGPDQPDPTDCPATCKVDSCTALRVNSGNMSCVAGQCSAGINCGGTVTCRSAPPVCEPGHVPSIVDNCWGPCVPGTQCANVRDCTQCVAPGQTCVTGHINVCVRIPERCRNNPSCACMGETVCEPPATCIDRSGIPGMACSCPTC
jgi:hypothetical protein